MTAGSHGGARPSLGAEALVGAVSDLTTVEARTVLSKPGVHLTAGDALGLAREAVAVATTGRGVVLTTGTDTLEELGVLCHALHAGDAPIVLTGAIRPASAPGADGPVNVADAAAVAAAAPGGTYVVFAGEIHAAAHARKVDSISPRAFASPQTGPLGHVAEGAAIMRMPGASRSAGFAARATTLDFRVPIVPTFLGDDGALLGAALALEPDALVLVALGAGHVSPAVLALVDGAACPVVATVRPERGQLLRETYGFPGAEGDLRAAGVIAAGSWSPQAARMIAMAALGAGLSFPAFAEALGAG